MIHICSSVENAVTLKRVQVLAHHLPRALSRDLRPLGRRQVKLRHHLERHVGHRTCAGLLEHHPVPNRLRQQRQIARPPDNPGEQSLPRGRIRLRMHHLVHVNCATRNGPDAMATLSGQRRAYLGAAGTELSGLLHELVRCEQDLGTNVGFNTDARALYLDFARDPATRWPGNFRDFSGSIRRLCTLAPRARITRAMVQTEIATLQADWNSAQANDDIRLVADVIGDAVSDIDPFELVQLAEVIRVCRKSSSLSAAGRALFAVSRSKRKSRNDADRLRKYLGRFDLEWGAI